MSQLFRRQPFEFDVTTTVPPRDPQQIAGGPLGAPLTIPGDPGGLRRETRTGTTGPPGLLALADFLAEFGRPGAGQRQQATRQQQLRSLIAQEKQEAQQQIQLAQQEFKRGVEQEKLLLRKKEVGIKEKAEKRRLAAFRRDRFSITQDKKTGAFILFNKDIPSQSSVLDVAGLNDQNAVAVVNQALAGFTDLPISAAQTETLAAHALVAKELNDPEIFTKEASKVVGQMESLRRSFIMAQQGQPTIEDIDVLAQGLATGELEKRDIPPNVRTKVFARTDELGVLIVPGQRRDIIEIFNTLEKQVDGMDESVEGVLAGRDIDLNLDRLARLVAVLPRFSRSVGGEKGPMNEGDIARMQAAFPSETLALLGTVDITGITRRIVRDRVKDLRKEVQAIRQEKLDAIQKTFKKKNTGFGSGKLDASQ